MRDMLASSSPLIAVLVAPLVVLLTQEEAFASVIILLSIVFSVICVAWETWTTHSIVADHFLKSNYDPNYGKVRVSARTARRLERISEQQNANVVVYSGFLPFVGSGADVGGWSFSLNVHKGKENLGRTFEPQGFEVGELYSCLLDAVRQLNFDGLITEDKLFVNGKDVREDRRFLPDPLSSPASVVSADLINDYIAKSTHIVRHYMCVRITDWKGELALSVFLRLAKNGASFFTEANYFLLTPIRESYRKADSMRSSLGLGEALEMIGVVLFKGLLLWSFSAWILLFKLARFFFRLSEREKARRLVAEDPTFDYGATGSLREYVSSYQYRRYFQKLDKEMYLKTVERLILDRIIQFLDEKDIDTSDLKDRQATILNNGVIVTGGAVRAKSLAVGQSAKASSTAEQ